MDLVHRLNDGRLKIFGYFVQRENKKISFSAKCVKYVFMFQVIVSISHIYTYIPIYLHKYIIIYYYTAGLCFQSI